MLHQTHFRRESRRKVWSREVFVVSIMFKKRTVKGNLRVGRVTALDANDSDEDESISAVSAVKLEQSLRVRKNGTSISTDSVVSSAAISERSKKGGGSDTIGSTLGSQFNSQMDYGLSTGNVQHEAIMEQFVNDRLGVINDSDVDQKTTVKPEDALYQVPEEFKVKSLLDDGKSRDEEDSTSMMTWSLGIAEVALPMAFKMNNIDETDRLRKKLEEERAAKRRAGGAAGGPMVTGNFRFVQPGVFVHRQQDGRNKDSNNQDQNNRQQASQAAPLITVAAPKSAAEEGEGGDKMVFQHRQGNERRPRWSSDDRAMESFKKRQRGKY